MQFLIIGLDGDDPEAKQRRLAARPKHIEMGDALLADGNLWYGAALFGDDGQMNGSMYLIDFESEDKLHEWLSKEPYIIGDVWKTVEVRKANVREPWQFNRPREFFENR